MEMERRLVAAAVYHKGHAHDRRFLSVHGMAELPRGQTDSTLVRSLRPLQCCVRSWRLPPEDVECRPG
jgi:hypothetical protein